MLPRRRFRRARGGVLLDAVLALGLVLVGASVLSHLGLTFTEILRSAGRFFGI